MIRERIVVVAAVAVAIAVGASLSIAHASGQEPHQDETQTRADSTVSTSRPVTPSSTPAPSPEPVQPAPPNGSSGFKEGIPFYDANSNPALIQYPPELTGEELAHAHSWVNMMDLMAKCMAEKGFPFEYTLWWDLPVADPSADIPLPESLAKYGTPEFEALYGDPYADDYDPQAGEGCHGVARSQLPDEFANAN